MPPHHPRNAIEPACGLLLVGHGSRERAGNDEFLATARLVAELAPDWAVEPSFLEFAEPSITPGFEALVRRGVRRVVVVPVLLFSAGHMQRDIPAAISAVAVKYPGVSVRQAEHLGCHAELLALSKLRYDEALSMVPPASAEPTALVMVGRGSRDSQATAEMFRFVELRRQLTPVADARACFVAMAAPSIESILAQVIESAAKRVVVQPHLLFGGVLLDRIGEIVERRARQYPQKQWITTQHLGLSRLIARAILDRASCAQACGECHDNE
ncbi:MAG: sirohydrochlorin chelatase [Planctomycetia bacterium]|nr:sirohydrochlorin chelatase [Planctomycetia bacterium]